jgi:hypothetical protein
LCWVILSCYSGIHRLSRSHWQYVEDFKEWPLVSNQISTGKLAHFSSAVADYDQNKAAGR